jgi:hypothetical protein
MIPKNGGALSAGIQTQIACISENPPAQIVGIIDAFKAPLHNHKQPRGAADVAHTRKSLKCANYKHNYLFAYDRKLDS